MNVGPNDQPERRAEASGASARTRSTLGSHWEIPLLVIVLLFGALYGPLNAPREIVHNFKLPIDDSIPFSPIFIVPYVSYYAFLVVTLVALFRRRDLVDLRTALVAALLTLAASYAIYWVYQSYVERPVPGGGDIFSLIVSYVYMVDRPYNAFPSLHTSLSSICALSWTKIRARSSGWMVLWAVFIVASTVLVKQHYIADVLGGMALAAIAYGMASWLMRALARS